MAYLLIIYIYNSRHVMIYYSPYPMQGSWFVYFRILAMILYWKYRLFMLASGQHTKHTKLLANMLWNLLYIIIIPILLRCFVSIKLLNYFMASDPEDPRNVNFFYGCQWYPLLLGGMVLCTCSADRSYGSQCTLHLVVQLHFMGGMVHYTL